MTLCVTDIWGFALKVKWSYPHAGGVRLGFGFVTCRFP